MEKYPVGTEFSIRYKIIGSVPNYAAIFRRFFAEKEVVMVYDKVEHPDKRVMFTSTINRFAIDIIKPKLEVGKSYTAKLGYNTQKYTAEVVWFDDESVVYNLSWTRRNVYKELVSYTERTMKTRKRFEEDFLS